MEKVDRPEISISPEQKKDLWALLLVAVTIGGIWSITSLLRLSDSSLTRNHDIAETVAAYGTLAFTTIGSLGAVWWWWIRDSRLPRLNTTIQTDIFSYDDQHWLLHVIITLHNSGEIPIRVYRWDVYALPIAPLHTDAIQAFEKSDGRAIRREAALTQAVSGARFEDAEARAARVRAGESQDLAALLLVPKRWEAVRIEAYIPHRLLKLAPGEERAWVKFTTVRFSTTEQENSMIAQKEPSDKTPSTLPGSEIPYVPVPIQIDPIKPSNPQPNPTEK